MTTCKNEKNISFLEPLRNPPAYAMKDNENVLEVTFDVQYDENAVFNFDKKNDVLANTRIFSTEKTRNAGQTIPGPTLEVRPGSRLIIHTNNKLPVDTQPIETRINWPHGFNDYNIHTHGLHVSPESPADNVCMVLSPGEKYTYSYDIPSNHPCGVYWYHPHKHGSVALQVGSGMCGMIVIRGPFDDQLKEMKIKEYNLIFQNIAVDMDGLVESQDQVAKFPNSEYSILTNAQFCPIIYAKPGEVINLRFLNGLTRSGLQFRFPEFVQMFSYSIDGNPFEDYREFDGVALPPGGRHSTLLKINEIATPGSFNYIYNNVTEYQQITGFHYYNNCPLFILAIEGEKKPNAGTYNASEEPEADSIPPFPKKELKTDILAPINEREITNRRTLTLQANKGSHKKFYGGFNLAIDHDAFRGCGHINHTVKLDAVEEWKIVNDSYFPHPIHIHVNPCYIVEKVGEDLLPSTPQIPYWADTFFVPAKGYLVFRSRFKDFTGKYPLHCHILYHEDGGMMQHVKVVE